MSPKLTEVIRGLHMWRQAAPDEQVRGHSPSDYIVHAFISVLVCFPCFAFCCSLQVDMFFHSKALPLLLTNLLTNLGGSQLDSSLERLFASLVTSNPQTSLVSSEVGRSITGFLRGIVEQISQARVGAPQGFEADLAAARDSLAEELAANLRSLRDRLKVASGLQSTLAMHDKQLTEQKKRLRIPSSTSDLRGLLHNREAHHAMAEAARSKFQASVLTSSTSPSAVSSVNASAELEEALKALRGDQSDEAIAQVRTPIGLNR